MAKRKTPPTPRDPLKEAQDAELDEELAATFPASDTPKTLRRQPVEPPKPA
ncbi:MAG: hypothetical protein Q8O58_06980 [Gallionella sp.]|nr:hypothetical protein [Gallionella sp.]